MASFYSSEGDLLPPSYLLNQKVDSNFPVSQPCVSLSFPNLLSESTESRDEAVYIPATGLHHLNISPRYSDGNTVLSESIHANASQQIPQYQHHHHHGLSLSLGSQESSLLHYTDSSLSSLLSPNNMQNIQNFIPGPHQEFAFCNSKYLKAAQDLLDELVSVHRAGQEKVNAVCQDGSGGADLKRDGTSGEFQDSNNNDLSPSERHELQNKLTKLLSMLEEVDKRYKQYCHQIQAVASLFDSVAGGGAALPYTALARRTISRQFRSLRDAIQKQIQATQKSLGDQDANSHGLGILSRLRFVDQQLRQQKALQQFGVMRQPWRPQRGLPETAVSVLRAWLFEHFLHPYPKDSEKIVLARQTGLTRSQVANWFINARVRLWKPMIEEMYKEEFGDPETEPKSSPEHATTAQEISAFDDRDEEFQGTLMSTAAGDHNHRMQSNESTYENRYFHGNEVNFGLSHMQNRGAVDNAPANKKDLIMDIGTVGNNQVSLALGLHHTEQESKPITDHGIQQTGNDVASSSSVVHEKLDYYYVDTVNNHESNFSNTHLLSDFVA